MKSGRLLIHACCAPCLSAPWQYFQNEGWTAKVFFFNPNIHPLTEYLKRRDCLSDFAKRQSIPLSMRDEYQLEDFLRGAVSNESERCHFCYRWRLFETARCAKEEGFLYFTTTLLISPYQKHELIRDVGLAVGEEQGVEFLYRDLRILWSERTRLTLKHNLYRQQYCGCIYSEKERYSKAPKAVKCG